MDDHLKKIKEVSSISITAYRSDWKTQRAVERTLQILVEMCIDIANHIIADKGMRLPTGYADAFQVLVENKVINRRLFKTMEKMARFRNLIVHQYDKIDPAIVISILRKNLDDFKKYKRAIIAYLSP